MKTLLIAAAVIGAGALGYYLFLTPRPVAPEIETPQEGTSIGAKINIDAVCDGALAYMSFPNGAEADAWVAACKRGEHPEAIEQWKQMNGITDDRAM
jgi:hypothetical protein